LRKPLPASVDCNVTALSVPGFAPVFATGRNRFNLIGALQLLIELVGIIILIPEFVAPGVRRSRFSPAFLLTSFELWGGTIDVDGQRNSGASRRTMRGAGKKRP
jgi:hypothetical protein